MKKALEAAQSVGIFALIICFIVFSVRAKAQALEGMKLCLNVIVPTLLPILILTNTIIKSSSRLFLEAVFSPLARLLRLPKCACCALILGLIGGYPTGAILSNELFNLHLIDNQTAKRLLRCSFCGGVAFIITAVGTIHLNSTKTGIIIYTINVLSSIIICVADGIIHPNTNKSTKECSIGSQSFCNALINSIECSTKSVAVMCGCIVFFSAICGLVSIPPFAMPLIEITNGIFKFNGSISLPYLCFFLSFGGLCIHLQILNVIKSTGIGYIDFFVHRVVGGLISYFLGKGYILLFNPNTEVFSNISQITPRLNQINGSLSIILLASCIVIVVDLNNKKSKLI